MEHLQGLSEILNYPLFTLEGHPISALNFLVGILLIFTGVFVSKRLSKEFDRRLLARTSMDEGLRYTFRRLIYYFFLLLSVLFTLRTLHVPLTVFTVIGGALAVGIGFGSQNLVNNFISGILVMAERPIRVGDFMEIDGVAGRVQSIGIRSTLVRTGSGALVFVPNSTFIQKNLTNWTMSGTIGSKVRFGVAYGTDTARLKEICLPVLEGISGIVQNPAPSLSFVDFGDNALIFDLSYAIESRAFPSRGGIESQIRYRLNDVFTQNSITIPGPQRDVHLRVGETVAVRLQN